MSAGNGISIPGETPSKWWDKLFKLLDSAPKNVKPLFWVLLFLMGSCVFFTSLIGLSSVIHNDVLENFLMNIFMAFAIVVFGILSLLLILFVVTNFTKTQKPVHNSTSIGKPLRRFQSGDILTTERMNEIIERAEK